MKIEDFLARLKKVKRTGPNSWLGCCPAHDDRSPSLSIKDGDDGSILIFCFAECKPFEIVGALGLQMTDLFPDRLKSDHVPGVRRPFPAADALEALASEAQLVAVAACNLANGMALSEADKARLLVAQSRIEEARRLANG